MRSVQGTNRWQIRGLQQPDVHQLLDVISSVRREFGLASRVAALLEPSDYALFDVSGVMPRRCLKCPLQLPSTSVMGFGGLRARSVTLDTVTMTFGCNTGRFRTWNSIDKSIRPLFLPAHACQSAALAVLKASRCEATKFCTVIGGLPVNSAMTLSSPEKRPF
jgi:hypothetical protein